jgi:cytochrome c-type biogenesis protein CcmE
MEPNMVIAVILIMLFLVLAIIGFIIYAVQNEVSFFTKRSNLTDEEEG